MTNIEVQWIEVISIASDASLIEETKKANAATLNIFHFKQQKQPCNQTKPPDFLILNPDMHQQTCAT